MLNLYEFLENRLYDAKRLVILGVGSILNSDDGAGVVITENLKKHFAKMKLSVTSMITGENAPENYTGEIKKIRPDHILVLDAVDIEKEPGNIAIIGLDDIGGFSFSTHMLPIKIMLDYLVKEVGCNVTIIGIQPKNLTFTGQMTQEVIDSIKYATSILKRVAMELEH